MSVLDDIDKALEKLNEEIPNFHKELVEFAGNLMYESVINNIDEAVTDNKEKLKKGIVKKLEPDAGYAAIRPDDATAPLASLIENGYMQVIDNKEVGWAKGKYIYRNAANEVADKLDKKTDECVVKILEVFK